MKSTKICHYPANTAGMTALVVPIFTDTIFIF